MGPRILLARGGGTGDVLLATSLIRPMRRRFPNAWIAVATESCHTFLFEGFSEIDQVVGLPRTEDVFAYSPPGFDLQFNLQYESYPNLHILDAFSRITGLDLTDAEPVVFLHNSDWSYAMNLWRRYHLGEDELVIGLHRGPTWPIRSWPAEKFRAVCRYFKAKYNAVFIELGREPGTSLGEGIDLTGKTSLHEAAAVVQRCSFLLCVDSLMMHVAAAVRTPVAAIFGGTDPDKRLPRNDISLGIQADGDCHGCHHAGPMRFYTECHQPSMRCMERLTPEDVIRAIEGRFHPVKLPTFISKIQTMWRRSLSRK